MTVNENDATIAVDAAARVLYAQNAKAMEPIVEAMRAQGNQVDATRDWPDLGPLEKNQYREQVLPVVWAVLEALGLHDEWGRRIKDDSMGNGHMVGHVTSLFKTREDALGDAGNGRVGLFEDCELVSRRVTDWEARA